MNCLVIYMNHSVRATAVQRLSAMGVSEPHIMSVTEHRNPMGLRNYSRTTDQQKDAMVASLDGDTSKSCATGSSWSVMPALVASADAASQSATTADASSLPAVPTADASFLQCRLANLHVYHCNLFNSTVQ